MNKSIYEIIFRSHELSYVHRAKIKKKCFFPKKNEADWAVLKAKILANIMDFYTYHEQAVLEETNACAEEEEQDPIIKQIKELIETRVRPAVAQDGGDITFSKFENGTVYLHMQGACAGCPSSTATLKHGIENMLKYYIPEIESVEAINPMA